MMAHLLQHISPAHLLRHLVIPLSVAQVYYVKGAGEEPLLLACEEAKPNYQRLEELMQPILAR